MRFSRREVVIGGTTLLISGITPALSARTSVARWRGYARSPYGQMHFFLAAPTADVTFQTPLVCLHQSPTSGISYTEFQNAMARDRLVLCADTAGYGNSDGPADTSSMEAYGAALATALDALGFGDNGQGPVDVLGFHTGNFVAAEVAIQRPDIVRRLVMPGIPYYSGAERSRRLGPYVNPRPYFTDPDYVGQSYRRSVLDADNGLSMQRRHEVFVSNLKSGTRSHLGFAAVAKYAAQEQLPKIEQPVLLPILNETLAQPTREASKLIRNHTLIEMPAEDGFAWFLQPEALATPIRAFLNDDAPQTPWTADNAATVATTVTPSTGIATGKTRRWRHFARTRFGQMHFVSAQPQIGSATRPPLALLHPSPMSGHIFDDLQQVLATDRLVLCPDTAGFGDSDGPPQQSQMADLGAALVDAIADLQFDEPIDIFGFHTGSFVTTEAVVQASQLFRRVILCGVPYYPADQRQIMKAKFLTPYAFFTDPDYVDTMYKNMIPFDGDLTTQQRQLARFIDRMRAGPDGEWGPHAVFGYEADEGLSAISNLTLLMAFNEVMTEPTRQVRELIPTADFVELPDLQMMGFVSHPQQVAAEIRRYLDTTP
ncbi:MAG: alpha/beta hydrolase [Gammaproteobacteria bacterium]